MLVTMHSVHVTWQVWNLSIHYCDSNCILQGKPLKLVCQCLGPLVWSWLEQGLRNCMTCLVGVDGGARKKGQKSYNSVLLFRKDSAVLFGHGVIPIKQGSIVTILPN